jgi:hypothetical protein
MKITFNTGRPYTSEGQVIVVDYNPHTGVAFFLDHSRIISGRCYVSPNFNAEQVQRSVLNCYDFNLYVTTTLPDVDDSMSWYSEDTKRMEKAVVDLSK